MTADAESEGGTATRQAGMDGFLSKPFGIAALRACIAKMQFRRDGAAQPERGR